MFNNNFLKAAAAQGLLAAVNLLTGFLFVPYLLKTVGTEAYGFYPLSINIINFSTLVTVILTSFLSKFITVEYLERDLKKLNVFFNSSLYGNFIVGTILLIPMLIISLNIEKLLEVPEYLTMQIRCLFVLISVSFFVIQIRNTFTTANIATEKRYLTTLQRAFEKAVMILLPIVLFRFFRPSVAFVGLSVLIAVLLRFFITVKTQKVIMPEVTVSSQYVRKSVVSTLISVGSWHSLGQISVILFSNIDILMANILLGANAQTLCSLALVIPNLLKSAVIYFTNWFLPFLSVLASEKEDKHLIDCDTFVKYMSVFSAGIISIVIGFGDVFLQLWIGNFYTQKLYILLIIACISVFIYAAFAILNTVLLVHNHTKLTAFVSILSGLANIPLSIWLSGIFGIYGILLSSLLLNIPVYAVFMPIYFSHRLKFPKKNIYKAFFSSFYILATGVVLCVIIKIFFALNNFIKLLFAALAVLIILLIILFIWLLSTEDFKFLIEIIKAKITYGNDVNEIQSRNDDSLL